MKEAYTKLENIGNETAVIGMVADQSPRPSNAYWTTFLNQPTAVFLGTEKLAKQFDATILFLKVNRIKRGYYETTFETITLTPKAYENYQITDIFLKLVEQQIHEAPEYYLWTHKRWKHMNKNS